MLAVWIDRLGPPEVLVARDTPDPVPGPGEVLVAVEAASITFIETLVRSGRSPFPTGGPDLPYVPGNGVGGVVSAVGDGADPSWIGRRVVTTTGGSGGYAELVRVPAGNLIPIPAGVSVRDATALLADGRTATGLAELAAPQPGEWVLVEAAAGGVGSLLVQLCRSAGARVVGAAGGGTAGGEAKLAIVRDLGAELAVDYRQDGWAAELRSATGGVDVVFDGVGGAVGEAAVACLRPGGRLLTFGVASGRPTTVGRTDISVLGFEALRSIGARASEFTATALRHAAAGTLRPVIGQTYPLVEAAAAHAAIEDRTAIGKTLLIV